MQDNDIDFMIES